MLNCLCCGGRTLPAAFSVSLTTTSFLTLAGVPAYGLIFEYGFHSLLVHFCCLASTAYFQSLTLLKNAPQALRSWDDRLCAKVEISVVAEEPRAIESREEESRKGKSNVQSVFSPVTLYLICPSREKVYSSSLNFDE